MSAGFGCGPERWPCAGGVADTELRARRRVWAWGAAEAWDARRPTAPHHRARRCPDRAGAARTAGKKVTLFQEVEKELNSI